MKNAFAILALGAAAVIAASATAWAAGPVTLKFGFPAPAASFVNTKGMTPWIKEVEKASEGTLEIKLFAGPTLGTFRNIYERTLAGVSQITFDTLGNLASQFPRTQVSDLPFLSTNTEQSSVALWRLYTRGFFAPEYDKVKVLALFTFPGSNINTNKPIKSIDELKGMKLAAAGRTLADIVVAFGASPVTLTPTEIYQAVSRGTVDGIVIGWTAVKTFRLDEVTKYHLQLPLGDAPAFVFMNKSAYASLPAKAKAAIDRYSGEAFSRMLGANDQAAAMEEEKRVAAEPGHSVGELTPAQSKAWQARAEPVIADWVRRTPGGAKLLAAYRAELKKIRTAAR
jgi:TRAP-type transport system periplasmic protein